MRVLDRGKSVSDRAHTRLNCCASCPESQEGILRQSPHRHSGHAGGKVRERFPADIHETSDAAFIDACREGAHGGVEALSPLATARRLESFYKGMSIIIQAADCGAAFQLPRGGAREAIESRAGALRPGYELAGWAQERGIVNTLEECDELYEAIEDYVQVTIFPEVPPAPEPAPDVRSPAVRAPRPPPRPAPPPPPPQQTARGRITSNRGALHLLGRRTREQRDA